MKLNDLENTAERIDAQTFHNLWDHQNKVINEENIGVRGDADYTIWLAIQHKISSMTQNQITRNVEDAIEKQTQ